MAEIDEKMEGLLGLQQALNTGAQGGQLSENYVAFHDVIENENRYWFAKVVEGEVLSLATFRENEPVKGVSSYSINYNVAEKHRRRGLAVEVVNKGIDELKINFRRPFYIDAIIDEKNINSIKVAQKIFPGPGIKTKDHFTGAPSVLFHKLVKP